MSNYIKMLVLVILLSIFSWCWSFVHRSVDLLTLYDGIPFDGNLYLVLLNYFLFSCYSFYIFEEGDKYARGYGIYVIIRSHSKLKIIRQIFVKVLLITVGCEVLKIAVYTFIVFVSQKVFYISDISMFLYMVFINIFFMFFFLCVQVSLELFIDSKVGLYIVQAGYLILIWLGNIITLFFEGSYLNMLALPNLLMIQRLQGFWIIDSTHMGLIYVLFLCFFLMLLFVVKKNIDRKDWI